MDAGVARSIGGTRASRVDRQHRAQPRSASDSMPDRRDSARTNARSYALFRRISLSIPAGLRVWFRVGGRSKHSSMGLGGARTVSL